MTWTSAILAALPVVTGVLGVSYGARLSRHGELNKWLRDQRVTRYIDTLEHVQQAELAFHQVANRRCGEGSNDDVENFTTAVSNISRDVAGMQILSNPQITERLVRYQLLTTKRMAAIRAVRRATRGLTPDLTMLGGAALDDIDWDELSGAGVDIWPTLATMMHLDLVTDTPPRSNQTSFRQLRHRVRRRSTRRSSGKASSG